MKNKNVRDATQIKKFDMPIIMQTQTFCSYILSNITTYIHVHSTALPRGKRSSHPQHLLQYLAHFPKQNKAANHICIPKMFQFAITLMKDLAWGNVPLHFLNMPQPFNLHHTHTSKYNRKIDTPTWYEQYYFEKPHPNFFAFLIIQEWMLDSGTFSISKTK